MNSEIGFGRKVLQVLEEQGISFEHVPSGIDTMTIFIHQDEFAEKEQQVIAGIHRAVKPDYMELETDLSLLPLWEEACVPTAVPPPEFSRPLPMRMSMCV